MDARANAPILKKETQELWDKILLSRKAGRPCALDMIQGLTTDFIELHGDRGFGDDPALVGGLAKLGGRPIMVLGQHKGADVQEKTRRNFGMMHPEGYRKALRLMQMAHRFGRPILSFVDTPGAYPGIGAEKRGQAEAIARNLREMFTLEVPILVVIIGEGGSGGALGVAIGDAVLMLENAYYSVISPEGCAAILWRDRARAPDAASALKIRGKDLYNLGIVDEVIDEPPEGAQQDPKAVIDAVGVAVKRWMATLRRYSTEELLERRYEKFRNLGPFQDHGNIDGDSDGASDTERG